jgi:hypothetical protein
MSFRSRCGSLLFMGALLMAPLAAQDAVRVEHISVLGSGQAIEVEIQTSGPVKPQSQMIGGPDRIVIDFPGALPAPELRALNVNRGSLKGIRAGLFASNPPVTRVVLDLTSPQQYQIFSVRNAVMLKVGAAPTPVIRAPETELVSTAEAPPAEPPKPPLEVTFHNGLLRIHAERATLAQVLFEVQKKTGADIAIPAGAESEEVAADLGPAPAREVLASLLNGSRYNFVFVGNNHGRNLQKAILTVR